MSVLEMPPANSLDRPPTRDDLRFNVPAQDRPPTRDDLRFNVPAQDRPPTRDDLRFNVPAQDRPPTRDDLKFKAATQDRAPVRDDQRLNTQASAEEPHVAFPVDTDRSRVPTAAFSHHSLSDGTPGDVFSQHPTRELRGFEQSPKQLNVSPEQSSTLLNFSSEQSPTRRNAPPAHIQIGKELSSQATRDRMEEHLPEADVGREGEDTGYRKMNQGEDHIKSELSNSPRTRDQHSSGNYSTLHERTQLMQSTPNSVQRQHHDRPSVNVSIQYKTTHSNNQTSPVITHGTRYHTPSPSDAEQQSERILHNRYRDKAREEAITIRRPRDHIKQWKDSIERLSTISGLDEFGEPIFPLISQHKISLPRRSKSMDGGDSRSTRTRLDNHDTLASRSRSSQDLSTEGALSQHRLLHPSDTDQAWSNDETEMTTSRDRDFSGEPDLDGIHRRHRQETPHVSRYTGQPAVKETNLSRGHTLRTLSPVSLESHADESHGLRHRKEQIILKKRFRSEPPSSGSRVRFQQQNYVVSDYVQDSRPTGYGVAVSTTAHRHRSMSPKRQAVSSPAHSTAELSTDASWVLRPLYSVLPKCRSPSPQQARPTMDERKLEDDNRNIHVSVSSEGSPAAFPHPPETASRSQHKGHGINVSFTVHDGRPSKVHSVSPGVGLAESSQDNYTLSSGSHVDRHYVDNFVDNFVDRRNCSPLGINRGGAGRVPRREAWELDRRRRNESASVVGHEADAQSGVIDVLFKEIEILREKIGLLERIDPRSRFDTETQTGSSGTTTRSILSPTYSKSTEQILLSGRISTTVGSGHERALSCPLLKLSRRSQATRSLSRNAGRSWTSGNKTALDSHAAHPGWRRPTSNLDTHPMSDAGRFNGRKQLDRPNVDYHQTAHTAKPHIYGGDPSRSFEPRDLVRWRQLISRRDLSKSEVIELKQAVACVLAENDLLQARLTSARQEVHDKLTHTNGVLEDCRHHLSKSQTENMQLRVRLEEEQARSQAYRSTITDLENSLLQIETDNQQLEQELAHTTMLLHDCQARTQPEIDDLQAENWRLGSRLTSVERQNADLTQEVDMLTDKQTKAADTMDGLRKCLARTRQEWQQLSDELATFKEHEHKHRVREIIKNYQEKGAKDEWEKEQRRTGDTRRLAVSQTAAGPGVTRDWRSGPSDGRLPGRLCKSPSNSPVRDVRGRQCDRSGGDPEIYPHRREHVYYSRTCSPHQGCRSSSVPGYSHPLSMDESFVDPEIQEMKHNIQSRKAADSDIQSSGSRLHGSRKRAPALTKEQRQYADRLVQKYIGQVSHKQPA